MTDDGTTYTALEGWIFASIGIVFWGLFAAPMKFERVIEAELHPLVFQFYMSIAIALSSLPVLALKPFAWTWYGMLGATLWTLGNNCAMLAVAAIGIGPAQCIWGGMICIISFLWGVFGNPIWTACSCTLSSTPLAVVGLAIVVSGIVLIVLVTSTTLGGFLPFDEQPDPPGDSPLADNSYENLSQDLTGADSGSCTRKKKKMRKSASYSAMPAFSSSFTESVGSSFGASAEEEEEEAEDHERGGQPGEAKAGPQRFPIEGPFFALGVAILAGSCLVPVNLNQQYAPEEAHGMIYAVSFGVSCLVVAIALCAIYSAFAACTGAKALEFSSDPYVVGPCMLSGLLWNVANILSDLVTLSPLGLTIGYPVMQTALIIGGLTGIVVFQEVTGCRRIMSFVAASCLTGVGAVVLGKFGACASC